MPEDKMKYAWDVSIEKKFSKAQLETINQISDIISNGGKTKLIKKKIRMLNL